MPGPVLIDALARHRAPWRALLLALPALWLTAGVWRPAGLGGHPLEALEQVSGRVALLMLLASLALTPMRRLLSIAARLARRPHGKRLSDWNKLVPWQRSLGLAAFAYATLHLGIYVVLDAGLDPAALRDDVLNRRHVLAGGLAWLTMLGLAMTSLRPGGPPPLLRRWPLAAACAAVLHFWWTVAPARPSPWIETLLLVWILGQRLLERLGCLPDWPGSDGEASPVRDSPLSPPRPLKDTP